MTTILRSRSRPTRIKTGSAFRRKPNPTPSRSTRARRLSAELRKASEDLKTRIAEAKRHNDLPVDSALGSPGWEQSVADGHLDQPEEDDDK